MEGASEFGKLYHLHPLIEFFLTFYVGYMISYDIRKTLLESLSKVSSKIKVDTVKKQKEEFSHLAGICNSAEKIIDSAETKLTAIQKDYSPSNDAEKVFQSLRDKINALKQKISEVYGFILRNQKIEIDFSKSIEPLSPITFYLVLYCVYFLTVNALYYDQYIIYRHLFSFNILSLLIFILYFLITFTEDKVSQFVIKIFRIKFVFFIFFISLLAFNCLFVSPRYGHNFMIRFSGDNYREHFNNCLVFFTIFIMLMPIGLNLIKYLFDRNKITKEINNDDRYERFKRQIEILFYQTQEAQHIFVDAPAKVIHETEEQINALSDDVNVLTNLKEELQKAKEEKDLKKQKEVQSKIWEVRKNAAIELQKESSIQPNLAKYLEEDKIIRVNYWKYIIIILFLTAVTLAKYFPVFVKLIKDIFLGD